MNQFNTATLSLSSKSSNKNRSIPWPEAQTMKQQFCLPDSIIYYITKNPSTPEVFLKLAKSCKYFFEKNPIIVVACIYDDGRKVCSKVYSECKLSQKCCVNIDIIKLKSKIWLSNKLQYTSIDISSNTAALASKLYRCESAKLYLYYATMNMKAFQIYASKFQKFNLCGARIVNNDGNMVMLENILESIPKRILVFAYIPRGKGLIKKLVLADRAPLKNILIFSDFDGVSSIVTASTMKNISQLQNLGNLQSIVLLDVPESFNVKDLGDFIKIHKNSKFWLRFNANISEEYKNQLDQLIDTVIASQVLKDVIRYHGQDKEKEKNMFDRYIN